MNNNELIRGLNRWDLTAITINTVIGAGIFGLPSKAYALIGNWSLVALAACALIIGLIILCYAEVSSRFTDTGGPYLYAREAFGGAIGFEVGWLYWIVRVATFAANCNLFITYLGFFNEDLKTGPARNLIIVIIVAAITAVNFLGVKQSAIMTNIFTVGKLLPLILLAGVGIFFIDPSRFTFSQPPEYQSFSSAVLLLIYAFVGFEMAVVLGGETKDPQRSIPFALLFAIGVIAVLFIIIQIVCIGTVPDLAASERPLADSAAAFWGPIGALIITLGALISILGNLNVGHLGGSRLLYAMAEHGELPTPLARVNSKFHSPYVSIIVTSVSILVLSLQSSFLTAVAIATTTRLLVYATTCLSLIIFRRRSDIRDAAFKLPMHIVVVALSLCLITWLITQVDLGREGYAIIAFAIVGALIFILSRFFRTGHSNFGS